MSIIWTEEMGIFVKRHITELACHCERCGHRLLLRPELIAALIELEVRCGETLTITNAYRCPDHNLEVGGLQNSRHIEGLAADIEKPQVARIHGSESFIELARACGFGGVKPYPDKGIYHLQVPPPRGPWP